MNTTTILTAILLLCALSSVLCTLLVLSAIVQAARRERSLTATADSSRAAIARPNTFDYISNLHI